MGSVAQNNVPQLLTFSTEARKNLNEFAETRRIGEDLNPDSVLAFLREMAIWGSKSYENIFGKEDNQLKRAVERIPEKQPLHIDTTAPSLPWEWLYIGQVPSKNDPFGNSSEDLLRFLDGFWGFRWEIDILPVISTSLMELDEHLAVRNLPVVLSTV